MALVHGELYTALVAAGVPPDKAEAAAQAEHAPGRDGSRTLDARVAQLEIREAAARAENESGRGGSRTVDARLAQLEIRVKVLSWMVGLALALIALLVLTHPNV
jgi:hypothetical protein